MLKNLVVPPYHSLIFVAPMSIRHQSRVNNPRSNVGNGLGISYLNSFIFQLRILTSAPSIVVPYAVDLTSWGFLAARATSDATSAESLGLYVPDMGRHASQVDDGISELVGCEMGNDDSDRDGLRTSRMFNFCGMCLCEFLFFSRHNAVDEKDRRTIKLLVGREHDVARILGKPGGFYMFQ
jgi:hypothetical protein